MKVVFFNYSDWLGGVETWNNNFVELLENSHISSSIYVLKKYTNSNCIEISSKTKIGIIFSLFKILWKERKSVVHVNSIEIGAIILPISFLFCIKKRILHIHNVSNLSLTSKLFFYLASLFSNYVFFVSEKSRVSYENFLNKKAHIFSSFRYFDFKDDVNVIRQRFSILSVGNHRLVKNNDFLLEILNELPQIYNLTIIGRFFDKESKILFFDKIKKYNLQGRITTLSEGENAIEYYNKFEFYVGCSFLEGLGLTAIEAQVFGLTTIISDGFPNEVVIRPDYVQTISLDKNAVYWANAIQKSNFDIKRTYFIKNYNELILKNVSKYISSIN
jgi:glycosyltransferase involved in cell wall biosynthesis